MVHMCPELKIPACPDRQIISLYLDGELPSPWKEKMGAHLESCPECRRVLDGYKHIGECLDDANKETVLNAQDRVWEKLTLPEHEGNRQTEMQNYRIIYGNQKFWRRTITVPLPAAAAAAVFIIVAMFAIFGLRDGRGSFSHDSMAAMPDYMRVVENDQGMVPINDMAGVLQYLASMDNGDFMVIRLPETRNFIRAGEPALINAADYSRRRSTR